MAYNRNEDHIDEVENNEDDVDEDEATEEWCVDEYDEHESCEDSGEEEEETCDSLDTLSDEMREQWPSCDRCGKTDCQTFPVQEKWLCMDCKYLPPEGDEPEPESQSVSTHAEPDEEPGSDHDEGDDEPTSKKARHAD